MTAEQKKIIERVRRLVALSGSDNPTEARNAAHKACALMREHSIVFGFARTAQRRTGPVSVPTTEKVVDDIVNEVGRAVGSWFDASPNYSQFWYGKSKFSSRCFSCAQEIGKGNEIVYHRTKKRAYHKGCFDAKKATED